MSHSQRKYDSQTCKSIKQKIKQKIRGRDEGSPVRRKIRVGKRKDGRVWKAKLGGRRKGRKRKRRMNEMEDGKRKEEGRRR